MMRSASIGALRRPQVIARASNSQGPKRAASAETQTPEIVRTKHTVDYLRQQAAHAKWLAERSADDYELQGGQGTSFGVSGPGQAFKTATASWPLAARFGAGGFTKGFNASVEKDDGGYAPIRAAGYKVTEHDDTVQKFPRPELPIVLYQLESCPYCKQVREALAMLDIDALIFPATEGEQSLWRKQIPNIGGSTQTPFMVDPNTGVTLYESRTIVNYLFDKYGDGQVPASLNAGPVTLASAFLAILPRSMRGSNKSASRQPDQPLVLWTYDGSPFCKLVQERLTELELPYLQKTVARGSPRKAELMQRRGKFQVPYIEDPNTGVAMFESNNIINYLNSEYAL